MPTSRKTPFLSEIAQGERIPANKLAFFQERLRNRLFDYVLKKFLEQDGLTKAELARRIGQSPERITRLLGAPGNWTLDTVSDLLLGIAAEELEPQSISVLDRPRRNSIQPEWIRHDWHKQGSTVYAAESAHYTTNVGQTKKTSVGLAVPAE
jgi:hypothetical protein